MKIKVVKNGPYLVSGKIPLDEQILVSTNDGMQYKQGKKYNLEEEYALCRCGHSKNMPFCDHSHMKANFNGTETASMQPYMKQAVFYEGQDVVLADVPSLCAFARFCHSKYGDAWTVTRKSDNEQLEAAAIKMACECPSGRLVMIDKYSKKPIEPALEPKISILQDPEKKCGGPLYVQGGIPIISEFDEQYEVRNRVTLCRCGHSKNKPFCDATHVEIKILNDKV